MAIIDSGQPKEPGIRELGTKVLTVAKDLKSFIHATVCELEEFKLPAPEKPAQSNPLENIKQDLTETLNTLEEIHKEFNEQIKGKL